MVEILEILKPSPLGHFNYSRRAADGIRNFKIFEPPPLTTVINIDNVLFIFSLIRYFYILEP
jgi:hypothetical protein